MIRTALLFHLASLTVGCAMLASCGKHVVVVPPFQDAAFGCAAKIMVVAFPASDDTLAKVQKACADKLKGEDALTPSARAATMDHYARFISTNLCVSNVTTIGVAAQLPVAIVKAKAQRQCADPASAEIDSLVDDLNKKQNFIQAAPMLHASWDCVSKSLRDSSVGGLTVQELLTRADADCGDKLAGMKGEQGIDIDTASGRAEFINGEVVEIETLAVMDCMIGIVKWREAFHAPGMKEKVEKACADKLVYGGNTPAGHANRVKLIDLVMDS